MSQRSRTLRQTPERTVASTEVDAFERAAGEALAVVDAGRTFDFQRDRFAARAHAERTVAREWARLALAEKVAVALDARLGYLVGDDTLFSAAVDDVVEAFLA